MRVLVLFWMVLLVLPSTASAWGFEAHRFITEQALALLPPELRPFFTEQRAFIVERSIDPDLWRSAGFAQESPNHFLDFDYREYGEYPFRELPRDYDRAVEKFGKETVEAQGLLPWRAQEFYGRLRRAFAGLHQKPPLPYVLDNVAFYSAVLSHYLADAHVPLHAVVNYDGQLTNQRGLHSRWEGELFARVRSRLTMAPAAPQPLRGPRDAVFDALLGSNRLVPDLLAADKEATRDREFYDDGYFEALAARQLPVMERQVNASITLVAAAIIGAWDEAGRPSLAVDPTRTPRRIPR